MQIDKALDQIATIEGNITESKELAFYQREQELQLRASAGKKLAAIFNDKFPDTKLIAKLEQLSLDLGIEIINIGFAPEIKKRERWQEKQLYIALKGKSSSLLSFLSRTERPDEEFLDFPINVHSVSLTKFDTPEEEDKLRELDFGGNDKEMLHILQVGITIYARN